MKKTLILLTLLLTLFFLGNLSTEEAGRWLFQWVFGLEKGWKYIFHVFFSSLCYVGAVAIGLYVVFKIVERLC